MWFFKESKEKVPLPQSSNALEEFVYRFVNDIAELSGWDQIHNLINQEFGPGTFPIEGNKIEFSSIPEDKKEIYFKQLILLLSNKLEKDFGKIFTNGKIELVFESIKKQFSKEDLSKVLDYIPLSYLEGERIEYLSREALELKTKANIKDLLEANQNLEKIVEERTNNFKQLLAESENQAKVFKKREEDLIAENNKLKEMLGEIKI